MNITRKFVGLCLLFLSASVMAQSCYLMKVNVWELSKFPAEMQKNLLEAVTQERGIRSSTTNPYVPFSSSQGGKLRAGADNRKKTYTCKEVRQGMAEGSADWREGLNNGTWSRFIPEIEVTARIFGVDTKKAITKDGIAYFFLEKRAEVVVTVALPQGMETLSPIQGFVAFKEYEWGSDSVQNMHVLIK